MVNPYKKSNMIKGDYVDMIEGPEALSYSNGLIVKVTSNLGGGFFSGVVVRQGETDYKIGYSSDLWVESLFKRTERSYTNT